MDNLNNLSLAQLNELAAAVKNQLKLTKLSQKEFASSTAQSLGVAITDTILVKMADNSTITGIVKNVTDKGATVTIEGRDRALFRPWHMVDSIIEKGEGVTELPTPSEFFTQNSVQQGYHVAFSLKGKVMTGIVKEAREKSFTVSFFDEATGKTRNLSRNYNSIILANPDPDAVDANVEIAV